MIPPGGEPFDMRLIQRGARLRRSPFFEATQRYGCRAYTVYNHMFLPSYYDDPVTEYWHLLEHVSLWDVGVERQVEITGPDAFHFTSLLTPRDLEPCAVGQGRYVLITAADGGIINDPVLLRLGENHFWLALADSDVLLWAQGVAMRAGKDALTQIASTGPARRLVGVEIAADPLDLNETVWPVHLNGARIGAVTSAVFSPRLRRNIGYAMLPVAHTAPGTKLLIETPLGEAGGTVAPMPFVDPRKKIPRA